MSQQPPTFHSRCMNQLLYDRSAGSLRPTTLTRIYSTSLVHNIQLASDCRFDGNEARNNEIGASAALASLSDQESKVCAHQSGVNALVVDRFDGRLLISGGADSSIKIWDLDQLAPSTKEHILKPKGSVAKGPTAHKFGITQLSFYPFDSAAFLSSSYDHTLKLYSTDTLAVSASFNLESIIYTHALSPIASHLLAACATQHPAVRLVDLRSGSSAHSLAGHHGAVLSVAWSPTNEHILASGDTGGIVRVWDVRKSAGTLGLLDMEDSVGVAGYDGLGSGARSRFSGKAHNGAVNGLSWTDDGTFIITAGHDERVRVWDAGLGANTLTSFGPTLKNANLSNISLLTAQTSLMLPGQEILFYPNEQEILMFLLHEGKLVKRMKVPGLATAAVRSRTGERNVRNRVTALAWRGVSEGIYSGHSDGQIRVWKPEIDGEESGEDENEETEEATSLKRKRQALDDVFRDLTRQKITFG